MLDELKSKLESPGPTPESAAETAIMVYLLCTDEIDKLKAVQQQARDLIGEIMVETGKTKLRTQIGQAYVTKPSTSVRYDAKALTMLCEIDEHVRHALSPHRIESVRDGTLTIRGRTFRAPED